MKKTLEVKLIDFVSELNKEIIELECKKDDYLEIRADALREVVDWLEVLLYAEEFERFRKQYEDIDKSKSEFPKED